MVVAFDFCWDFALLNEEEDGGANLCHGDHAGSHIAETAGGVGEEIVLVITGAVEAGGDFTAEERVTEPFTGVDVCSCGFAEDGVGPFGRRLLHEDFQRALEVLVRGDACEEAVGFEGP